MKEAQALSLFTGIGGFEVGMSQCGFSFKRTLEWDKHCCETLRENRYLINSSESEIKPIDITKTPPKDFYGGQVDYIVGGPPCQSFSAAGRRAGGVMGIDDTRGSLFWHYCRYVKHFAPKAFVFENVRGICASRKGEDFQIICASFRDVGYDLFWMILNAADYGVPQQRERLFLVGIRMDLAIQFKFPKPTHGPDSPHNVEYVTAGYALRDLENDSEIVPPYGGKYGHLIPDIPPGENYRYYTEEMGHKKPQFAWRSKFSGFLYKLDPDDLSRTIVAYQSRYDGPFHWKNRKCTVDELKCLQGFPVDFIIPHQYNESVKQIGNSVCPPVARQIGRALRFQIEGLQEFEVPLLENGEKLSFDKRKGLKARQSHAKKKTQYSQIRQISLFNEDNAPLVEMAPFDRVNQVEGATTHWLYEKRELRIKIFRGRDAKYSTEISLQFFGGVVSSLNRIIANSLSLQDDQSIIQLLWSEIHDAIGELTSYDSLLPLWGHFTEPYPKFDITFKTDLNSRVADFQKIAIDKKTLNKVLKYEVLDIRDEDAEIFLKSMRKYGFDVRTHNTNKTIPERHFKVCYPFTMPKDLKQCVVWADASCKNKIQIDTNSLFTLHTTNP